MRKFTVLIDSYKTVVNLQDSVLTSKYEFVFIKRATVFWEYYNVTEQFDGFRVNDNDAVMYSGYYTFKDVQKLMRDNGGVDLQPTSTNGGCYIKPGSGNSVFISTYLSRLLGLTMDDSEVVINPDTTYTSKERVNINLGLEYINISCNLVNDSFNVHTEGTRSDVVTSLAVTTTQSLLGSVTEYFDIESKVPVNKGSFNQLKFYVTDQDGKPVEIDKILLELYIV
jgi:hypothetical protein